MACCLMAPSHHLSQYWLTTSRVLWHRSQSNFIGGAHEFNLQHEITLLKLLSHLMGNELTHWGRVTHICVSKLTIIGSDNGLSPGRRQAIIWINAGILLIGPLGTNFSEIYIAIQTFSFKKMHLRMSSAKWHPFCPGLNVLMQKRCANSSVNCLPINMVYMYVFQFIFDFEAILDKVV